MESLNSQPAPDEFVKENHDGASNIETLYTDPSVSCSNLKSVSESPDVLLVDQTNGNSDSHNVIQSEDKTLENSENLYVTENIHTDCDNRNLYQDINCEDVNRHNSSTVIEANCKVSVTDDPLYLEQENKTGDRVDDVAKDKVQVLNGKVESDEKSPSTLSVNDKDYVKLLGPDIPCSLENNVNNIDESPFEDVNKCSISETESHENSLQDPLLISDGSHSDNSISNTNKTYETVVNNNVDLPNRNDESEPKELSHNENAQENQDELAITEALLTESQVEDFVEHDTQKELEALLAPQSNNIVEGFGEDSILIANLSVPPPIQLIREIEEVEPTEEDSTLASKDIINHIAKKPRLDGEFQDYSQPPEGNEGKPSLLKILPIKNGHSLWSLEELKIILEEQGSVLLRLCGAPEAGNEDIIDGPKADFTALLLDETVPIPDVNGIIEPEEDISLNQHSIMDEFTDTYLNEEYTPPFWKHRVPDSKLPCVPKKKRLPPGTRSFNPKNCSTPGQYRGRKRGRPPLHNRAWIPKMKFSPPTFIDEPIKFRPPTPPAALVSDGSRLSGGLLEAALTKNAPSATGKKILIEPLLQSENNSATKSNERNEKGKKSSAAMEEDEHISAGALTDDSDHAGDGVDAPNRQDFKPKKVMIRIPCPHCPLTFRKKLALTGHMKLRHKTLKKCPICQESIRMKGKFTMQYHISKVHKDEKNFECDICHLKFTLFHHLKNHKRLMHDVIINNSAVNSDEEDEPASPIDTIDDDDDGAEKNDASEEMQEEDGNVKRKVKIVRNTRTTRSGIIYKTTTNLIQEDKNTNKKSTNSSSKVKIDNSSKENQNKSLSSKVDDSNLSTVKSKESMRSLRSRSAIVLPQAGKSNSKEKESLKINEDKNKKVTKAGGSENKRAKHDTADYDDAEEEKFINSENGNESDDEDDSESDSEVEEKKKYFCDKCEMGFSHVFKLRHHKKKKHSSAWSNSGLGKFAVKGEPLTCKLCQKKCRSEQQFNDHILQHKNSAKAKVTGNDNGQLGFRRKSITSTRSSTESSDSQLRIDESETEEPSATEGTPLKSGEIPPYIVRRGRIYFCTKCNLSFKRERQMTYHLKKIHEALYPFRKCPDCPRVFRSSGPFTRHLREHRGKRCPVDGCKAKYKVLRMIKKHQRHAHPRFPHRCTRCVALFVKESELESHTKNEHKESSDRRSSRDEDDDDDDDEEEEDEVEEECEDEEEEDEAEEEEEKEHAKDRGKEQKSKVQTNINRQEKSSSSSKKSNNVGNDIKNESLLEGSTTGTRRTRSANISYKEDDDEDDYEFGLKTVPVKANILPVQLSTTTSVAEPSRLQEDSRKLSFPSHSNPLKNLREAIMMQNASKAKPHPTTTEAITPILKPKRPYVRRAPYKKRKVDNSWTAAVKAQYQSFPSSESSDTTIATPNSQLHTDSMPDPSPVYSSPGITADVVRRVAESLLNRHQEQKQQQNKFHNLHPHPHLPQHQQNQEKPLKPQKRPYRRRKPCNAVNPSFISYNAKSSQLPRITYSSLVAASASRENSMSSMDDSSHADPSEYYGTSFSSGSGGRYFSVRHHQTRIPDDEDSGPPKVLRFDSF